MLHVPFATRSPCPPPPSPPPSAAPRFSAPRSNSEAAWRVVRDGLLDADELYTLVVPRRTFDRRREDKVPLTIDEGDRLLRVIRVVVRAREALGDEGKAHLWLRTPNRALRGEHPLALLVTDIGARMVERVLGRLEHGVAS